MAFPTEGALSIGASVIPAGNYIAAYLPIAIHDWTYTSNGGLAATEPLN